MGEIIINQNNHIEKKVVGAVFATGLMSFCGVIVETAMNITFPTLMKEFSVATNTVQWMTTLYLLVVAALVPLSATFKRRFKMRPLFLTAISFFILGVVLDACAPTFWLLLLGRGIQGLGTGIALPLMFNIILEQVPKSKVGMMMGIGTMITGVAPAIGPTFGGLVVSALGWRYVFIFLLPVLIFALVLGLICIQQKTPVSAAHIDSASVLLIIVTFCSLIFGISNLGSQHLMSLSVGGALLLGLLALVAFTWRSLQLDQPIINLRLFAGNRFTVSVLAFTALQISALGLSFLLPNYIQLVNGNSALQAGLIVLPGAVLGAILGPLSGRLYDHVGAAAPLRVGGLLAIIGVAIMAICGHNLGNGLIIAAYTFFMAGMGLSYGNIMTSGLSFLDVAQQSDGNAIFNTVQQFAAALGTSVAAAVVAAGQKAAGSQAVGTANGTTSALIILLVLVVVELLLVTMNTRRQSVTQH